MWAALHLSLLHLLLPPLPLSAPALLACVPAARHHQVYLLRAPQ
jgi:hypothetical protein